MAKDIDLAPNPVDVHVGLRIRLRRKELGVSQEKLAEAIGLTFQQVQKYERAANRVSASKLWATAAFLEVEVTYFFEGLGRNAVSPGEAAVSPATPTRTTVELQRLLPRLSAPRQRIALDIIRELAEPLESDVTPDPSRPPSPDGDQASAD